MLKIADNENLVAMCDYCAADAFGCRILAAYSSYGLDKPFAQFWLQYGDSGELTAVVGSLDDALTLCAKGDYDCEEIDAFVSMLAGKNGILRPARAGEAADGVVLRLAESPQSARAELNPPPEDVYMLLERCPQIGSELPPFEEFYSDLRHRTRVGTAKSALIRESGIPASVAVMHLAGGAGLLTTVATAPEHEGKGFASSCVSLLINECRGNREIFAMSLPGLAGFYERLGFAVVSGYVY